MKANFLLAENSIVGKQEERYKNTVDYYEKFVGKFPQSKYRKDAEDIFKTSSKKLKQLKNDRYQIKSTRTGS